MSMQSPLGGRLACDPLTLDQARLLVAASPTPLLIADVGTGGFSVLAVDALLRRFITGARHPAGPMPGEIIDADGFTMLGPALSAAVAHPDEQQVLELPIGDEPRWFEVTVTPVSGDHECSQVLVMATDRTADHDLERHHRRSARRLEAMVTHAPGLILLVDSTGRVIRCSPAVDRLLGMKPDQLVGRAIFERLHPDALPSAAASFNQLLSQPGHPVELSDFRLHHTDGRTLWCEATATNLLHDDDVAAIVINAHDITDRRLAEERLELLATSDALTGLPNRRRLEALVADAFDAAARADTAVGLVLVDLDDFKLVNDGLGHDVGDAVLRALASRLDALVSRLGFAARLGGDEFALVMTELSEEEQLRAMAASVHETLRSPIAVGTNDVYLRASIGTTSGRPDSSDPASLLRSADLALYQAKRNGRNQTVGYSAELQLEAERRLTQITSLQAAIEDGLMRLAYQPIVDESARIVGAEALLRWEHDGQLLSPARFLGLAEDTGLILPMGAWVLDQACRDAAAIAESVSSLQWVSVNLSSRQLLDEQLPTVVRRTLQQHRIEPAAIAVEIDEATVRENEDRAIEVLQQLDDLQVMLSLTDLALDQGILSRIPRVPVDTIKLDQAFVQQLDVDTDGRYATLAMAVLDLASELGLRVVAEGVENATQARILGELGCHLLQGFHFGEPLDLGSFITHALDH